jgi:hypothetical protein
VHGARLWQEKAMYGAQSLTEEVSPCGLLP